MENVDIEYFVNKIVCSSNKIDHLLDYLVECLVSADSINESEKLSFLNSYV